MQIELSSSSRLKLDQILQHLYINFDLEELSPDELIDAILDLGTDLIVEDDKSMSTARERLIEYCGRKVGLRADHTASLTENEFRG